MFSGYSMISELPAVAPATPVEAVPVPDPDALSMGTLARELELQERPPWLLCQFMNALERKRQAQGLGWSRPWNKVDLTIFRTHTLDVAADAAHLAGVAPLLAHVLAGAPAPYADFARALLADPARMAFAFYHNRDTAGAQFEGVTLSFGRRVAGDVSKRDRVDVILEDRRAPDGRVDGQIDLLRVYVCPWSEFRRDRRHHLVQCGAFPPALRADAQALFDASLRGYHAWKDDAGRQWKHWSQRYIDYFGARKFIPAGTSFT